MDVKKSLKNAALAAVLSMAVLGCGRNEQTDRKALEDSAKVAIAKLSGDMVPIPGKDYALCKYEVTQALWFAVMGELPSYFQGAERTDLPVENVSWNDCQRFLEKLNAMPEVKASGRTYRLPTADEWEYACRAGATGDYGKLADGTEITDDTLGEVAWYSENSKSEEDDKGSTHPVGRKMPNALGLYDMLGNVWEWTSTADGENRVDCGGSCRSLAEYCKFSYRGKLLPISMSCHLGFRLAY